MCCDDFYSSCSENKGMKHIRSEEDEVKALFCDGLPAVTETCSPLPRFHCTVLGRE